MIGSNGLDPGSSKASKFRNKLNVRMINLLENPVVENRHRGDSRTRIGKMGKIEINDGVQY